MHERSRPVAEPLAPLRKRCMRAIWRRLPRGRWSFNLGKLVTRSILRPESHHYTVNIRFAGEIPMQLNLGCFVTNDLYCLDDHYESVTLKLWRHLAQDSRTILDIGSHIGTFALVAASRNQQAQVIAVEADPDNFALLRNHCVAWHNITSIHAAIADRADEMWFLPEAGNDGGGRLSSARPPDGSGFPVRTISLADLCRQQRLAGVDLMKLDVEGFEHTLMTMNSDFWEEFPPQNLIVELTCERHKAALTEDLFHAMKRRGYRWRRVQGLYAIPWGKPCDLANWHFWR